MAGENITVRVSGKGLLKKYITSEEAVIPHDSTISALISYFKIPAGYIVVCFKDGKKMSPSDKFYDGDSIIMAAMMAGG
jgi:hypothetical protein